MEVFQKEYALAYDHIYHDKDYERECDFIEAAFKKHSKGVKTILDLGCGTGGHALILAKRGYKVTGIDCAEDMLAIAEKKAADENLHLKFIKGDITNTYLHQKFDAVIAMFAVMGYQTTNSTLSQACLAAKKHLSPNGIFIFDCWHGTAVLTEKPGMRIKEVKVDEKDKIIRFTEPILDILTHTVETKFKLLKVQKGHLINETNESHFMRFLFPQEIKYFLEVAGFKKIQFCPFLELEKPLTEHNWNMAVIATA